MFLMCVCVCVFVCVCLCVCVCVCVRDALCRYRELLHACTSKDGNEGMQFIQGSFQEEILCYTLVYGVHALDFLTCVQLK
jgi:hypothetical protein